MQAPKVRWALRAPCDWVNVPPFTQSLRRRVSSGGLGCSPGEHVFFASQGNTPIPRLDPPVRKELTCGNNGAPLSLAAL